MENRRQMRALPWMGVGYLLLTLLVVYCAVPTGIQSGWFVPRPDRSIAWYQLDTLKHLITWGLPFLALMWVALKRSRTPFPRRSFRRGSKPR